MASWVPSHHEDEIPSSQEFDTTSYQPASKRQRRENNGDADVRDSWESWDSGRVATYLSDAGLEDVAEIFKGLLLLL